MAERSSTPPVASGASANPPSTTPVVARDALERVLARAAELQASRTDDEAGMTEAQLVELAAEVGLSRDHIRQALAEERARIDLAPDAGIAHTLLGTATIHAARAVPGEAAAVLRQLDAWMQKSESLQVKRRFPGQLAWEPRRDFLTAMRRTLRLGGRNFHLSAATEVLGVVAPLEGRRSHARLVASLAGQRAERTTIALAIAGAGVLVGLPLFWLATDAGLMLAAALSLIPALVVPMVSITLFRRGYLALLNRAQVALEQALDRLEYEPPRDG